MIVDETVLDTARSDAASATARSGTEIRLLLTSAEFEQGSALLAEVWGTGREASPLSADLLRSLSHAHGCVLGALDGDRVVGLVVGVSGEPMSLTTYSLIAAVAGPYAGHGIGRALKLAQRVWALERGARSMAWTYDPLVRRNAHFNLSRLGGEFTEYLRSFYPPMHDAVNRDDIPDRLLVTWELGGRLGTASRHGEADQGTPVLLGCDTDGGPLLRIAETADDRGQVRAALAWIPPDIEQLRRSDPDLARRWRLAMREAIEAALADGLVPRAVTPAGYYLMLSKECS